ncbi:MAG: hypothetical protein KDI63_01070 [Gammaproteobacteria bacterium]|nr:hypothetical protein [Gammaproteobacteria bacterium]
MNDGHAAKSISQEYHGLIARVANAIAVPPIDAVLLPAIAADPLKQDEFGFVILADGSAGPFYTCLGDTRQRLDALLPGRSLIGANPLALAHRLGTGDLYQSALALGALNAVSQHVMRRAGFDPAQGGTGTDWEPSGRIGMVGYFGPLIAHYLARGLEIIVVERLPERVPDELGLRVVTTPQALGECDVVICTASTLINASLDEVLAATKQSAVVNLMGPSASLLPDPLWSRGVDIVGGVEVDDVSLLRVALAEGRSWGKTCRKYQLTRDSYPGLEWLLARVL